MNKEQLKEQGKSLLNFSESRIQEMKDWISHFPVTGRCPNGQKNNLSKLKTIKDACDMHDQYGLYSPNIDACLSYWDESEIDSIVDSFIKADKVTSFTHKGITFINESPISEKVFMGKCKEIVELINSLSGFHQKATEGKFSVVFKSSSEISSKAKYVSAKDEVWLKHTSKADSELYGHLKYILVHELGHRYEHKHGLPDGFNDNSYRTTQYSYTDAFSASEAFAEVFALSHWKGKYEQYDEVISKFNNMMSSELMTEKKHSLSFDF
ncbi:hypothetical protein LMH73_011065 [Vibrio splendidus]|nr:hypothetical protein [Vibrio splendidus]MCC4880766.1 hypothetical protein [Vibrio splendidus]